MNDKTRTNVAQRILIVSDFYAPFVGGAERQVQLLGKELVLRGHEVHIATVWHHGLPPEQDDHGVQVHRIKGLTTLVPWFSKNPQRRYHPPFPDPAIVFGLRRIISKLRPDVVHANGWIAYSCAAALIGSSIPLVVSARDYGYSCATRTLLRHGQLCDGAAPLKCLNCAAHSYGPPKALAAVAGMFGGKALLKRKVSAVHSVSTFVQKIIKRDLLESDEQQHTGLEKIPDIVIPSFLEVPPNTQTTSQAPEGLPGVPFILFVGSLQSHKGLTKLIEAYQRLSGPPPLVLIGTVWHDTPTSFPPGVVLLGTQPHSAVMAAWERCLFGVAPSVWPDPLPGVVREAMSKGKAVIATAVGGNLDMVVSGETGLLIPPGDEAALADAMQLLIGDGALRERLGRAAQRSMRSFTAQAVLPRFESLYKEVAR